MGKRGPAKIPTKILKLRGSGLVSRVRRKIKADGLPAAPEWLGDEEADKWEQLVPMLQRMGILGEIDAEALGLYCTAWVRWRRVDELLAAGGLKVLEQARLSLQAARWFDRLVKLQCQFGMTPSARADLEATEPKRLTSKPGKGESPWWTQRIRGRKAKAGA